MQQNTPDPNQALQLLDNVCAQVQLNRADHVAVQQAVSVLRELITTQTADKAPEPEKTSK